MARLTDEEYVRLLTVVANELKFECEAVTSAMDRCIALDRVAHMDAAMQLSTILLKLDDARTSGNI